MAGNILGWQTFRHHGNKGGCGILDVMQPGNSQPNFSDGFAAMEDLKHLSWERRPDFCGRSAGRIQLQISNHPVGRCVSSKTEDAATGFTCQIERTRIVGVYDQGSVGRDTFNEGPKRGIRCLIDIETIKVVGFDTGQDRRLRIQLQERLPIFAAFDYRSMAGTERSRTGQTR